VEQEEAHVNTSQNSNGAASNGEDEALDPRSAATLLEETELKARRELTRDKPVLSLVGAPAVLVIYGALWFSVRGQHPYVGPDLGVVGFVYILVAVVALITVSLYRRAVAGVSGPSRREEWVSAIPMIGALIGVYTFMGALKYNGFSQAVVYGVFDAAAPWVVVGAVLAALGAAREDWGKVVGGLCMVAVGAGAAFAGPINVWGILAVCGFVGLLIQTALRWNTVHRP
jgi:hypothetical protein